MSKKYEFVYSDTIVIGGRKIKLTRIRATRSIPRHGVTAGMLGGYLESGANLSQDGDCWVGGDAKAYTYGSDVHASVSGSALVTGTAEVQGGHVLDNAVVCDNARVAYSTIRDNAKVSGSAKVGSKSYVSDNAHVTDFASIQWGSMIWDNAVVSGKGSVFDSNVFGNAKVTGNADLNKSSVAGDAVVEGKTKMKESTLYKNNSYDSFKGAVSGVLVGLGLAFMFPTTIGIVAAIFIGLFVSTIVAN